MEESINIAEDIYNENCYLLTDEKSPIMKKIIERQTKYRIKMEHYAKIYSNNIEIYKSFIELAARLVKNIGLPDNSISYSRVFTRLLYDGYLSDTSSFFLTIQENVFLNIPGFLGMDIINGAGCCRHIASAHQDLFNVLNLDGDILCCIASPTILELSQAFNNRANHVVNLLNYNGMHYIHDILNQEFYKFSDCFTMVPYEKSKKDFSIYYSSYCNQTTYPSMYYKPSADIIMFFSSQNDILTKLHYFYEDSNKQQLYINTIELNEILNETDNNYNKSYNDLKNFKHEAKEYTKKIILSDYYQK